MITVRESLNADDCLAAENGDGGQATTASESSIINALHAVWDGNRGQATTTRESITTDIRHAVRNGDRGQAATAMVFASLFLSAIYILNGRKVVTWIL